MRIDHIAYRVKDKEETAQFLMDFLGYKKPENLQDGFDIQFEDGTWAKCLVLEPPEKVSPDMQWKNMHIGPIDLFEHHLAPEIFVSSGSPGSIVDQWVQNKGGIGGIHHVAYQVDSVQEIMDEWISKGFAEFASEKPLKCPGLTQVFTKPMKLTGVIYEFIEREAQGFCAKNVKSLMNSTKNNKF